MFLPQRDPAMVFLFFIPSKLVEGIKRGESAFEFSLRFSSYRSACQQPIGTRFLRAIHKKNRELYGVEFCVPSLQIFVPSSFPSFFLDFLPSFFSRVCRRYDLLPNDRVSVIHMDHYSCF